jgi:hypothetical protein
MKVSLYNKKAGKDIKTDKKSLVGQVNRRGSFFLGVDLNPGRYCLIINSEQIQDLCVSFYSHQKVTLE